MVVFLLKTRSFSGYWLHQSNLWFSLLAKTVTLKWIREYKMLPLLHRFLVCKILCFVSLPLLKLQLWVCPRESPKLLVSWDSLPGFCRRCGWCCPNLQMGRLDSIPSPKTGLERNTVLIMLIIKKKHKVNVSSPRFVVCPFVLMCREGTMNRWLWAVCISPYVQGEYC